MGGGRKKRRIEFIGFLGRGGEGRGDEDEFTFFWMNFFKQKLLVIFIQ